MKFSANLGFLWTELSLPDAIHAAHKAGFDAVECHWPYEIPAAETKAALEETGLKMLGLNTQRGDLNGLSAVSGRETEARGYIDEAIAYANATDTNAIHVMAGFTDGGKQAEKTFRENLVYACAQTDKTILIEPLNSYDAPDYHISTVDQALETVQAVAKPNLKIMFDCYHIGIMQGDLTRRIKTHLSDIGHIQFAAVPDRSEPDNGEINYQNLLPAVQDMGWETPFGAEYKPRSGTSDGLSWLKAFRS